MREIRLYGSEGGGALTGSPHAHNLRAVEALTHCPVRTYGDFRPMVDHNLLAFSGFRTRGCWETQPQSGC